MENLKEEILELHRTTKLTFRQIADKLGTYHSKVSKIIRAEGLTSHHTEPLDIVDSKNARCRRCLEIQSIDLFQWGRKNTPAAYQFSYCNKCRREQIYDNLNSNINSFLGDRYNVVKRRSKSEGIAFTISKEDYLNQYNSQEGKCFYSDRIMVCKAGNGLHTDSLSVDKIIPSKGYVLGNVVFCSNRVNSVKTDLSLKEIKEWMPGWYQRIMDFIGK